MFRLQGGYLWKICKKLISYSRPTTWSILDKLLHQKRKMYQVASWLSSCLKVVDHQGNHLFHCTPKQNFLLLQK